MGRRKQSGLDLIAAMPWPVGIVVGILGFLLVRYGIGIYFSSFDGPLKGLGALASERAFSLLAWLILVLCWIGAAASFVKRIQRKRLLDTQEGLESISAMTWREFEMLVGEAFRRQGYSVEETGLGGADGGIDLVIRKNGRTELVQCKQWRSRQIKPAVVREMWGLVDHHKANGVKIVAVGDFTRSAAGFAQGKSIELINGERLIDMIRSAQAANGSEKSVAPRQTAPEGPSREADSDDCPACGGAMTKRINRRTGAPFMGCTEYPRCKGTRAI